MEEIKLNDFLIFLFDTFQDCWFVLKFLRDNEVLTSKEYAGLVGLQINDFNSNQQYWFEKNVWLKQNLNLGLKKKKWLFWAFLNKEKYNTKGSDEFLKNELARVNKEIIFYKVLIKQLNRKLRPESVAEIRNTYGQFRKLG